jgi:hypothetical protein
MINIISNKIEAYNLRSSSPKEKVNLNEDAKKETKTCRKSSKVKNQKKTSKNLKSLIKETLYNSTAQAIINLIDTPIFTLKIFLFLCVILSSCLCSYLIFQLIVSYLSFGVTTTLRTSYETPALFPKITICNTNPFTTRYAAEFLRQLNREFYPDFDVFNSEQMSQLTYKEKYGLIGKLKLMAVYKMNGLNETEKRKLAHPLEEILFSCSFNFLHCEANDFTWVFDPWYGNCWIYNSGFNRTGQKVPFISSSLPGLTYGFQMSVYVNFYKNLTLINSYAGSVGALVRTENSSQFVSSMRGDDIKLEPGQSTSISLGRSFKSNLPRPYSNCLIDNETNANFGSELFDLIQNSKYRYNQELCFWQCIQRAVLKECNCTNPALKSLFSNASQCMDLNEIICVDMVARNKRNFKNDFFQQNCQSECPLECYSDSFDYSLSSSDLISQNFYDYLNSNSTNLSRDFQITAEIDPETARRSYVWFNIFYKSLTYELTSESPQLTFVTLIANIGGYLGLFMGVSVFSIFEPVQILIEILYIKYHK